jgi:hypothetical protein
VTWFESFEAANNTLITSEPSPWKLRSIYAGCGPRHKHTTAINEPDVCVEPLIGPIPLVATSEAFKIYCSPFHISGECALRADSKTTQGGAVSIPIADTVPSGQKVMVRGYLMDECGSISGAHWMSPNFKKCTPGQEVRSSSHCTAHQAIGM